MGREMAIRLGNVEVNRRAAWVLPAVLGAAVTAYLAWGAWVSAHDPKWSYAGQAWWRTWLQPDDQRTLLVAIAIWIVAWVCYWWPRRLQAPLVTMVTVVSMVLLGGILSTASLIPCSGGQTETAVVAWLLGLYLGNSPSVYGQAGPCPGQPPLALQLGEVVCLGATLVGALAAASVLWRRPVSRLLARAVSEATVFTGLDAMTMPVLQHLARNGRPGRIIVIEPEIDHPLLDEARATGARVMIGDPASDRVLRPVLAGWRGCALSYLYALRQDVHENEAVLAAAHRILCRYRPHPERQPHLIARIDDPRHANHWRGWRCGTSNQWFEDALSAQEVTAAAMVNQVFRVQAQQLLLCGDSTLALGILLELARRSWERRGLIEADAVGRAAYPDAICLAEADGTNGAGPRTLAPHPLEHVVLMDRRAEDLRREYLATSAHCADGAPPEVTALPQPWKEQLLATLDAMVPDEAAATAVVIADALSEDGMHEAGRVARLHQNVPVFVLTSDGAGSSGAIFDLLHPFQRTLLVDGQALEDTWTRVARHWHECHRLRRPPVPGDPKTHTSRPWADLDDFIRQDNILELRSVMTAVVACGRRWVPRRAVPAGSFIELSDRDLEKIARAEHERWSRRRLAAGWTAGGNGTPAGDTRVNPRLVPWHDLPAEYRASNIEHLRSQLSQLESAGFMPIVPAGGPPEAAAFERVGVVQARQLQTRRRWTLRSGDELTGDPGDWRVIDDGQQERTVRDLEFRTSHEPLGGVRWRRTGTFRAWRVTEELVLRTMEGRAVAKAGDWVVEGHRGQRWPVTNEQFRRTYKIKADPD
jgi:RyR domain